MTLPASGTISMAQIAAELGISAAGLSLGDSRCRALAGVPSGPISFSNFYGKSSFVPGLTGGGTLYDGSGDGGAQTTALSVNTDGSITVTSTSNGLFATRAWGSPLVAGIGSQYWVRFTQTATSQTGTGSGSASASTGWLQLTSARSVQVSATKIGTTGTKITNATYTIEISKDGGASVVASAAGYALKVASVPI